MVKDSSGKTKSEGMAGQRQKGQGKGQRHKARGAVPPAPPQGSDRGATAPQARLPRDPKRLPRPIDSGQASFGLSLFLLSEKMVASKTATIPVRNMPSKVPAPPIETTGAPSPRSLSRFKRSAPMSVPRVPEI